MQRKIFNCFTSLKSNTMFFLSGSWLAGYCVTTLAKHSSLGFHNRSRPAFDSSLRSFAHKTSEMNHPSPSAVISKPPNVLVYTVKDDRGSKFELVRARLHDVLSRDSYTVYPLDDNRVLGHPWSKNSILLVIYNNEGIEEKIMDEFKQYIKDGGNCLCIGCGCKGLISGAVWRTLQFDSGKTCAVDVNVGSLDVLENTIEVDCWPYCFTGLNNEIEPLLKEKKSGSPVVIYHDNKQSKTILSVVDIFCEKHQARPLLQAILKKLDMKCTSNELPQLTPAYLLASDKDKFDLMESLKPHLTDGWCKGQKMSLYISSDTSNISTVTATEDELPLIINNRNDTCSALTQSFDWTIYKDHLRTHTLGRIVVYTDVIHSTQTLLEGNHTFVKSIPKNSGVIAVTNRQLKGKGCQKMVSYYNFNCDYNCVINTAIISGRGGNAWLSPDGCMMFSIVVKVKFDSELGSRLPYIQHIASLAFILAVKCIPGYENINICLKWPNDIYYGKSVKIGGVVISSSALGNKLSAVIGMGVNLSNKEPTICINEIIKQYNIDNGTNLAPLQREFVLARTISYMEELVDGFQKDGRDSFLEKYYQHWMHGGCKVTLNTGSSPQQVTITGLDDFGFLMVKKDNGEIISLQPDGNTFDILANLIEIKT